MPILALAITLGLTWNAYSGRGELISVEFKDATGITPGQTTLKFREITVGQVESVRFTEDLRSVLVEIRVDKDVVPYVDADAEFLAWIEASIERLRARDKAALAQAVKRSCEIKAQVVGCDERESGLRAILNFGHTFGHAIEAGLGYGEWLHGEAVGCGMVMAADLSARLGLMPAEFVARVRLLCERAGLPVVGPALGAERYLQLMQIDKKSEGGEIRFVVIDRLGSARMQGAPEAMVREVLAAHCNACASAS